MKDLLSFTSSRGVVLGILAGLVFPIVVFVYLIANDFDAQIRYFDGFINMVKNYLAILLYMPWISVPLGAMVGLLLGLFLGIFAYIFLIKLPKKRSRLITLIFGLVFTGLSAFTTMISVGLVFASFGSYEIILNNPYAIVGAILAAVATTVGILKMDLFLVNQGYSY